MRAIILAAGYSTRLWPLTIDRAKPAVPFMNRPLVGYVAEYLARYNYREVLINLHHQPDSVREALGDGSRFGVKLYYIEEPEILGTSGAWDNARDLLAEETFLAINGKIITDIDLDAALRTHREANAIATLVLRPNRRREKFSIVEVRDGLIDKFGGMPVVASDKADDDFDHPLMFTGIQILDPRIFSYVPRNRFSHSTVDVYPAAMAAGERVVAHVAEGEWAELSTIPRYLDIHLQMLAREGRKTISGKNVEIHSSASVTDAVMWDDVVIEKGVFVRRAVLGDGVIVPPGRRIENAAVVRADLVRGSEAPPKALAGEFDGDNFIVPFSQ
ncbi:MAG TPA: NDP-sugar synthase [Pyrinomonadaceae bacterium]|nr:NDP-sugar synthase [Pyrinomonadaceae bacterium]